MKKNIFIFLDVDGVLNTSDQWKRMYQLNGVCVERFIAFLKTLGDKHNTKIILTSTWKNGFDPLGNHSPHVQKLIDSLASSGFRILGKTSSREDGDRAAEISDYIASHKLEKDLCIVIDDDPDIFVSELPTNCKTVWVDSKKGFYSSSSEKKGFLDFFRSTSR